MPEGAQAIVAELVGEDEEDIHGANLSLHRWSRRIDAKNVADHRPCQVEYSTGNSARRSPDLSDIAQEKKELLEENIEEIIVQPTGKALLTKNPAGQLPQPDFL
jgi:hypothetical protein